MMGIHSQALERKLDGHGPSHEFMSSAMRSTNPWFTQIPNSEINEIFPVSGASSPPVRVGRLEGEIVVDTIPLAAMSVLAYS